MTRSEVLHEAEKCVTQNREAQYGKPENNFQIIANLWNNYLGDTTIKAHDVGIMMALLKIARIKSGMVKDGNYVDAIGYMACSAELNSSTCIETGEKMVACPFCEKVGYTYDRKTDSETMMPKICLFCDGKGYVTKSRANEVF